MPAPLDPAEHFQQFAHPERLVSTEWLNAHLDSPGLRVVESDEDILLYDIGHIPGAVRIDWFVDLNDDTQRDYLDGEAFTELMRSKGINRDDTIVLYGDKSNWWATYALWIFTLFGHEDVRILDGGRDAWFAEDRDLSFAVPEFPRSSYPAVERDDSQIRAYREDVLSHIGQGPLVDVRSLPEYTGERTHMPDYPQEGVLRGGHIPTAVSVPWALAAATDGRFRTRPELEEIYAQVLATPAETPIVAYCRIGERSSHTWFVLTHLLGREGVRNYDGSWTEWGNAVRMPVAKGSEPGRPP